MADGLSAPRMRGFTLLEIMVALAVFATLAAAVLSASQYVVKQTGAVEERLFAAWLADNHLHELRLQPGLDLGQQDRVVHMDRRDWLLRYQVGASTDPRLLKIDIEVSLSGRGQTLNRSRGWIPARDE